MSQSQNVRKEFGALEVAGFELNNKVQYSDLTAASTLSMSDSGKTFYLNAATEFATTLPAVASAAGFRARFVVKAAPSGASYTVVSPAANIHGNILSADDAAGDSAKTAGTGVATISFVNAKAVIGDFVDIQSDGVRYYISGSAAVFDGISLS